MKAFLVLCALVAVVSAATVNSKTAGNKEQRDKRSYWLGSGLAPLPYSGELATTYSNGVYGSAWQHPVALNSYRYPALAAGYPVPATYSVPATGFSNYHSIPAVRYTVPSVYSAPAPVVPVSPAVGYLPSQAYFEPPKPVSRVVDVQKVVNVQREVTVPQVVEVKKVVTEPKLVQLKKIITEPKVVTEQKILPFNQYGNYDYTDSYVNYPTAYSSDVSGVPTVAASSAGGASASAGLDSVSAVSSSASTNGYKSAAPVASAKSNSAFSCAGCKTGASATSNSVNY